jgi:hypothetical protein
MSIVEIPADLLPAIEQAIARGGYANEQELVSDILRAAVPVLADFQQLRRDVQTSLNDMQQGRVRDADFDVLREKLCAEYDDSGNRQ